MGDRSARSEHAEAPGVSQGSRFVWPPRPVDLTVAPTAPTPQGPVTTVAGSRTRRRGLWEAFEDAWLAPTALPLALRADRLGWQPDPASAYCDRCGQTVGPHESGEFGCAACRGRRLAWDRFVRLGEHRDALRDWVHEVKFARWRRLGWEMGRELGDRLIAAGAPRTRVCVVPAPMAWAHRALRGIDHASVIGAGVAERLGCPLVAALRRERRPSQRGLSVAQRRKNVAGAFHALRGVRLEGWHVVVVDDVMTTGATMRAMCRTLRRGAGMGRDVAGRRGVGAGQVWAVAAAVATRNAGWSAGGGGEEGA